MMNFEDIKKKLEENRKCDVYFDDMGDEIGLSSSESRSDTSGDEKLQDVDVGNVPRAFVRNVQYDDFARSDLQQHEPMMINVKYVEDVNRSTTIENMLIEDFKKDGESIINCVMCLYCLYSHVYTIADLLMGPLISLI